MITHVVVLWVNYYDSVVSGLFTQVLCECCHLDSHGDGELITPAVGGRSKLVRSELKLAHRVLVSHGHLQT